MTKYVVRGGSWTNFPEGVRSASRFRLTPENRNLNLGFRLAQDTQYTDCYIPIRGGSCNSRPEGVRSVNRFRLTPESQDYYLGFRIAQDIKAGDE